MGVNQSDSDLLVENGWNASRNKMKLYVVVTVILDLGDEDIFGDVLFVTDDEKKAKDMCAKVNANKPIEGLDYDSLTSFDEVTYFERELNKPMKNEVKTDGKED